MAIPAHDRPSDRRRHHRGAPSHIKRSRSPRHHHPHHRGITGKPPCGPKGDRTHMIELRTGGENSACTPARELCHRRRDAPELSSVGSAPGSSARRPRQGLRRDREGEMRSLCRNGGTGCEIQPLTTDLSQGIGTSLGGGSLVFLSRASTRRPPRLRAPSAGPPRSPDQGPRPPEPCPQRWRRRAGADVPAAPPRCLHRPVRRPPGASAPRPGRGRRSSACGPPCTSRASDRSKACGSARSGLDEHPDSGQGDLARLQCSASLRHVLERSCGGRRSPCCSVGDPVGRCQPGGHRQVPVPLVNPPAFKLRKDLEPFQLNHFPRPLDPCEVLLQPEQLAGPQASQSAVQ